MMLSLTSACTAPGSGDQTEIGVDYDLGNLKEFSESRYQVEYEILPLKTPENQRIKIYLNNIEVFKDRIVISTLREGINIFDQEGNFINRISKGEDVKEVRSLADYMINRDKERIEVLDLYKMSYYSLDGEYISSNEEEDVRAAEYATVDDKKVFLRHKNADSDYSFLINPGEINFERKTGQTTMNILNPKHFHKYEGSLYITGYSDKVYRLSPGDSLPKTIAYVKNMLKNNNVSGLDRDQYESLCASKDAFTYLNNFFVYDNNLWGFSLAHTNIGNKILMDKELGEYYKHPLTGIPYSQNNRWVENGTEYYIFPSDKMKDDNIALTIEAKVPKLHKAMQQASREHKMWIIKAKYSLKK
jgi:hypothetical protein